jgi:hypothetical protein
MKIIRENPGKSLLVSAIIIIWALLLLLFKYNGYNETWHLWGVQTEPMTFMDFRLIPSSAESFRNGYEPSVENPYEPGGRIFNYPAIWRLIFYTKITQEDTVWISILIIVLFFMGVILFPQNLTISGAFWMLLIIFSPASMLLYERGNVDLIVFFICALAILATDYSTYLALGLILFGAIVKIYPFFGLTVLLKEPKRKFIVLVLWGIGIMLAYSVLTYASQRAAWNTTWRGAQASYGTFVLLARFESYFQPAYREWLIGFEVLAFILILIAMIPAVRNVHSVPALQDRNLAAFRMGASIYLGTFLLGNNWDYRLAFLIFVVPQLAEWFYSENKKQRYIAVMAMLAVILSCWHFVFLIDPIILPFKDQLDRMVVFDEIINWILLPCFAYLLAASFQDWLKQDLQKVVGVQKSKTA